MPEIYRLPKIQSFNWISAVSALLLGLGVILGLFAATQYTAFQLKYRPELGKPVAGNLYNPFHFLQWQMKWGKHELLKDVFIKATGMFTVTVLGTTIFLIIFSFRLRSKSQNTDLCGSAHWASHEDIENEGLLENKRGLYIGGWYNETKKRIEYLRYSGEGNILGCAPTGTGKGIGMVLPNLLTWPESIIVNDVKGENWALSSGFRKSGLNNIVLKFDPTDKDGNSACFNPLWEIRKGENEIRDAQNIVEILCDPHGTEERSHWTERAQDLLLGLIIHVLYSQPNKSLGGVFEFLSGQGRTDYQILEEMLNAPHDPDYSRGWRNNYTEEPTQTHPTVYAVARELTNLEVEERSGIISTARRFLKLFKDPIITRNTSRSDFRITDLMLYEKPVSLYIVIPESDRERLRPLVRIIIKLISSRLLEKMEFLEGRSVAWYKHPLLLVLDEFSGLGKLQFIEHDLAIIRGYGIKALIIVQSIAQIYKHYSKDESITSNCQVKMIYAPNKWETAQEISNMAGISTVMKFTKNVSGKMSHVVPANLSEGTAEVQRPLITPDEVSRLPKDDMLIFVGSMPVIYGKKIRHYEDPVLQRRSQIPPPKQSDKISMDVTALGFPTRTIQLKDMKNIKNEVIKIEEILIQEKPEENGKDTMAL